MPTTAVTQLKKSSATAPTGAVSYLLGKFCKKAQIKETFFCLSFKTVITKMVLRRKQSINFKGHKTTRTLQTVSKCLWTIGAQFSCQPGYFCVHTSVASCWWLFLHFQEKKKKKAYANTQAHMYTCVSVEFSSLPPVDQEMPVQRREGLTPHCAFFRHTHTHKENVIHKKKKN